MVCICDIKATIKAIINQRKIYMVFDNNERKCQDFDFAKEKREEAKKFEEEYWEQLEDKINAHIQYPQTKKWMIFKRTKKAEVGYDNIIQEKYIKIPEIDKKEYYCVIDYLNKNENFLKVKDRYILMIKEE